MRASLDLVHGAFLAAMRAADDSLAARAASRIARLSATWLDQLQEGERWVKIAEAAADRAGPNKALQAEVLASRIALNMLAGHPEKNLDLNEQRIQLVQSLYGEDDPRVADAFINRGATYGFLNQHELSLSDTRRGLEIQIRVFGANYPLVGGTYSNFAASLIELGRFDEAKTALQRGMEIQSGLARGTMSVNLYINLGTVD